MRKRLIPVIIIASLLSGCSYHGNHVLYKNGDFVFFDSDNLLIELSDGTSVRQLFGSNDSFSLYYGLPGCSTCEEAKEQLESYVREYKQQIYYVSSEGIDLNALNLGYTDFSISGLYVFDDGQFTDKLDYNALKSPKMIKNNLNGIYRDTEAYVFNSVSNFSEYLDYHSGDAYVIDRTSEEATVYYNKNVKNNLGKSTTAIIYKDTIAGDNRTLLDKYGIQGNYTFAHLKFGNGQASIVEGETIETPIY